MKKLVVVLFVFLFSFIFVGCSDVPDFPSNQQFVQILADESDFIVTSTIYFCKGDDNMFGFFYPEFEYSNKFGDKNRIEFNYICSGYYEGEPDKQVTIFVKMFQKDDDKVNLLKIVWEM